MTFSPPDVEHCDIRLRDTRTDRLLLLLTVMCLGLAIGGSVVGITEILLHPACGASLERY